eukprot:2423468-Amphidinium_carterae.1
MLTDDVHGVGADEDRSEPYTLSNRPGRNLNAQSSRSKSALVAVRSISSGRVKRVGRKTETIDDIELKRP